MSGTRGTTVTVKEHKINGALYIDGQLIGDCFFTEPDSYTSFRPTSNYRLVVEGEWMLNGQSERVAAND